MSNLLRTAQVVLRTKLITRSVSSAMTLGGYVLLATFSWKVAVGVLLVDWGRRMEVPL